MAYIEKDACDLDGLFGKSDACGSELLTPLVEAGVYESARSYRQELEVDERKLLLEYQVIVFPGANVIDAKIILFNDQPKSDNLLAWRTLRFRKQTEGLLRRKQYWQFESTADLKIIDEQTRFLVVRLFAVELKDADKKIVMDLLNNELSGQEIRR